MSGYVTALAGARVVGELAAADPRVVLVSQDFGPVPGFTERFPERHIDVGISEQNLIGVAAGLAHAGKLPFVLGMAPFVSMRGFEQIRDDCAYNWNDVKIIAPFAGLEAGAWGATHHALEDIALLRTIPGLTLLSPADPAESERAIRAAATIDGPVYIRLGALRPIAGYEAPFRVGEMVRLREGDAAAILATGGCVATALAAHDTLAANGFHVRVLNVHTLKPLDHAAVERAARETGRLVTVEEHFVAGGLGGAVAEVLAELGAGRLRRLGARDRFLDPAPYRDLLGFCALTPAALVATVRELIAEPI